MLTLLGLTAFALIYAYYYPFLADDALISLRYAQRLAAGAGLSWNDNYFVEGYSNLSWVLAVAALNALGLDPILAARFLGILFAGGSLAAFLVIGSGRAGGAAGIALLLTAGLLHPVVIWAVGGLEQPLVLAALFAGCLCLDRWWDSDYRQSWLWLAGAALAVLVLTRPDGALFAGLSGLVPLVAHRPVRTRLTDLLRLAALPAAAFLGQMAFRLVTYGEVVPNTAHAKAATSPERMLHGLSYLLDGLGAMALPLALLAVVVLLNPRHPRRPFWVFAAIGLLWAAYIMTVGGDIFPGFRHFVPLIALVWVMILHVLRSPALARADGWISRSSPAAGVVGALVVALAYAGWQIREPENHRAKLERWEWECKLLAEDLRAEFGASRPLIGVTAAGCLPYWTEFETVDLLGLNDLELPNRKPAGFGTGYIGHELGDVNYLLERAPHIVVFNVGSEPAFIYKEQIPQSDAFHSTYCRTYRNYRQAGQRVVFYRRDFAPSGAPICQTAERPAES